MYVKGVGMTQFGKSTKPDHLLIYDAALEALKNSDMTIKDVDAIAVSNLEFYFHGNMQRHMASLLSGLFKVRKPIVRVPAACAGGGTAFWNANRWFDNENSRSGNVKDNFENILVVGGEKLHANHSYHITEEFMMAAESRWEQNEGLNFPTANALVAQNYLNEFDCTMDDLAKIAFKNHSNAQKNPKAFFYNKPVTIDKIKSSPVVASPLRLFDCSVSVDGGAAAVISREKTDVKILGSGMSTDYLPPFERDSLTTWDATVLAAKDAYKQAGLQPKDIDVAEVHDAFTIVELLAYEDLGFAKKGEGAKLIRNGTVELDGKLPINTSGGLKAKGHPVSATGLAQIYEVVNQLRGNCDERQVGNAKVALTQNIGGAGGTVAVNIFKKL